MTNDWILARIDELIKKRGWTTHNELANQAGFTATSMSDWYSGRKMPSLRSIISICAVFDISLSEFFSENKLERATARENELLDYWEDLSEESQDALLQIAKNLQTKKD